MKKIFDIVVIWFMIMLTILVLVSVVNAVPQLQLQVDAEIKEIAPTLNGSNDVETVENVWWFMYDKLDHRYSCQPQSYALAWYNGVGDCTERAIIGKIILGHLGIETRFVHGKVRGGYGNIGGYDWLEYYINESWYDYESRHWDNGIFNFESGLTVCK